MKESKHKKVSINNHNVILYVDTKNINKHNVEEKTSFDQYDMNLNNHTFKTYVEKGNSITWAGLSISAPNDKVIITKIEYESESNIFGRRKLRGDCCDDSGKVIGTARNHSNGKSESYNIYFQICEGNNGGLKKKVYKVDPQIEVDP